MSNVISVTLGSILVQYYMFIPIIIPLVLTVSLRFYYLKTSTQVKRLENIARNPLYSHIYLSLLGISTTVTFWRVILGFL